MARPPAWRRRLPSLLLALAVAALAIALARPQREVTVAVEQASVMLVMDASGSMEATDVEPTRLAAAVEAAHSFLDAVPAETKVGLVAFSTAPYTAQAPTTDRDVVSATLDSLVADGGTATGDALVAALQALGRNPEAPARGGQAARRDRDAVRRQGAGRHRRDRGREGARELGVPIYTVALGTPDGVVIGPFGEQIPVPPDPESLRQEAKESGGKFFEVDDAERLSAVYEGLGSQLGTKPRKREMTAGFAGFGLVLLAGALGAARWRGRLPVTGQPRSRAQTASAWAARSEP